MPATKIETDVSIELKRLKVGPEARSHRLEKVVSLSQSFKALNQQLQEILVCPRDEAAGQNSEFFDVLAGEGRMQAEESLGWEKGRCTIMYGLSAYEKLKVTLDENEEREPVGPIDTARIYEAMMEAEKLSQEALAKRLEIAQPTLGNYFSVLKLAKEVPEINDWSLNLEFRQLLQLCRLDNRQDKVELGQKAAEEEWTVSQLTSEVNKRLPGKRRKSAKSPKDAPIDPCAAAWAKTQGRFELMNHGIWGVSYGPFGAATQWTFRVMSDSRHPQVELAAWFTAMGQVLAEGLPAEDLEISKRQMPTPDDWKSAAEAAKSVASLPDPGDWSPLTTPAVRLPGTPEAWAELEALARKGPGAIYSWTHGPTSPMAQAAKDLTWDQCGYSDPVQGCHGIIKAIQSLQPQKVSNT